MDKSRAFFGLSTKNIPFSSKTSYIKRLIEKTEAVIRNMRWRAFFYLNPKNDMTEKETYDFKSKRTPPAIEEMRVFENRMTSLIQNIEFSQQTNDFQQLLKNDISGLHKEDKLIVKADKTSNQYKMSPQDYSSLKDKHIQKSYKKVKQNEVEKIDAEAKMLAERHELDDRIDRMAPREAFVTLKDHKENFQNSTACRLINPAKSELGKISKVILEKIVKQLTEKTSVKLWRSTQSVLDWFDDLDDKRNATFINFDIVDYYPSITEKLLNEALDFAAKYVKISQLDRDTIIHAKKTLLFSDANVWSKKTGIFDVTMGSYDGAEACELVACYLLYQLNEQLGHLSLGLYRDDGLAVSYQRPQQVEKDKKLICKIFQKHGLKISIEANKKTINYLDVTMNLNTETYEPYTKPNNVPIYVHVKSNHPPAIIKAIPKGINYRLSSISSNEEVFDKSVAMYQEALERSGHKHKLTFEKKDTMPPQQPGKRKRARKRNVTWFNPPYDKRVRTNVGREFLRIVDQSFPQGHCLRPIFNRNTLKISYSCMPNIKNTIEAHNTRLMSKDRQTATPPCNCRNKNECPLNGECRSKEIVYQATVVSENKEETYIGATATEFKQRYANHKQSFNKQSKQAATELSKHIWDLKSRKKDYTIKWKIVGRARAYTNVRKKCDLCILEKFNIIFHHNKASLNKKSELIGGCRHSNKFTLKYT